jgi:NAD-dependent SIR2 family protein deacetylase
MTDHMQLFIYDKGAVYSVDCSKCGETHYIHEWTTDDFNWERDAMESGKGRCPECNGLFDPETFWKERPMYAGRYSAPGYLDCTSWHYSPNEYKLKKELRELYE